MIDESRTYKVITERVTVDKYSYELEADSAEAAKREIEREIREMGAEGDERVTSVWWKPSNTAYFVKTHLTDC